MKAESKHGLRLCAVTVLLFLSHWVYYKVTFGVLGSNLNVLLELVYPAVFFAVLFLALPPVVPALWMMLGCAGSCVFHVVLPDSAETEFFYPLLILPALLFCFSDAIENSPKKKGVSALMSALLQIYPYLALLLFAGLLLGGKVQFAVTARGVFGLVLLLLIAVALVFVSRSQKEKHSGRKQPRSARRGKTAFLPAAAVLAETAVFAVCFPGVTVTNTVPLAWIVSLLFLYDRGEPSVCAFVLRVRNREDAFLNTDGV